MFKAGLFTLSRNNTLLAAGEGEFECSLGLPKASAVRGGDGKVKGFEYEGQDPMVSGEILVERGLDIKSLMSPSEEDVTIAIKFQDGTLFTLREAEFTVKASLIRKDAYQLSG